MSGIEKPANVSFGLLFKRARLKAGFDTLQDLSDEVLSDSGLIIDPSLLSHWQRGARLPKDRKIILLLLKLFVEHGGIASVQQADEFSEASGMGFLTDQEKLSLFPILKFNAEKPVTLTKDENTYYPQFLSPITKVHFIGSLDGDKKDYQEIVGIIEKLECELVTKHSLERDLVEVERESHLESELYVRKMKSWIEQADIVIIEATKSVFGAGYEAATALYLNKPVIILYRASDQNSPYVLKGMESEKLQVINYTDKNIEELIKNALQEAQAGTESIAYAKKVDERKG